MMFGERILNWKLKWNKNYKSTSRFSKPYKEVKKIGLVIKNDNPKFNEKIQSMVRKFLEDGKMVEVLCYQRDIINSKYSIPFFSFTRNELSWQGEMQNSHFKKLLETKYDYLISISDEMDDILNYLLHKSPALLRIGNAGIHTSENADLLIHKDDNKNLGDIAEQMSKYIKKLR